MEKNHPEVKFGKTGVLIVNLEHQTLQMARYQKIFKRIFVR